MNELVVFGLGIVGIFSVLSSLALLQIGIIIDRFPTDREEFRERSLASPIESTRIFVGIFWLLFALGGYALLQGSTLMMIAGFTTIFAICLFILTALVFSFAVYSTMRHQSVSAKAAAAAPVPATEPVQDERGVAPKHGRKELPSPGIFTRRPTGNFITDSLFRRE